jgi:hypothetical protein
MSKVHSNLLYNLLFIIRRKLHGYNGPSDRLESSHSACIVIKVVIEHWVYCRLTNSCKGVVVKCGQRGIDGV